MRMMYPGHRGIHVAFQTPLLCFMQMSIHKCHNPLSEHPKRLSFEFDRTLRPLKLRTLSVVSRFRTVEEVFASDATPIAHTPEDATLVVEVDGCVELGHVSGVHD